MKEEIILLINYPVGQIIFNRPGKYNAIDKNFIRAFNEKLDILETDSKCRLIILRSSSANAFSAGVDLNELNNFKSIEEARAFAVMIDNLLIRLLKIEKPLIAIINGIAYGGGFAIASACDLRIITENGKICFPAGRLGAILPPALTFMLNALIGAGKSRDLLLTGRLVHADEALQLGLANRVIKSPELNGELSQIIDMILKSTDMSLQMTRRVTNHQLIVEIEKFNLSGADNFAYLASTKEWKDRISSFLENRKKNN